MRVLFFFLAKGAVSEHTQWDARHSVIVLCVCVRACCSLKVQTAAGEALEPHERAAAPGQSNQEGALLLFLGWM